MIMIILITTIIIIIIMIRKAASRVALFRTGLVIVIKGLDCIE